MDIQCGLCAFFTEHLIEIYFLYGLAFFVTGVVVWLEASRASALPLARALPFLAGFGAIHGGHEWIEMFQLIAQDPGPMFAQGLRLLMLTISFFMLVEFGIRLLALDGWRHWRLLRWIILTAFVVGEALVWVTWSTEGEAAIRAADTWCRYSLAVPGAVLAAIGLCRRGRLLARQHADASQDLIIVGLAFLLYGIPGQIFVGPSPLPPSTIVNSELFMQNVHFPVQLLRTVMASLVAIFTVRALRVFELERRLRMEKLNQARLQAQQRLTEEMASRETLRREMLHRTVQAQEEERRYIARELHDEASQALTGLSLELAAVEEIVSERPEQARIRMEKLRDLAERVMENLRQLTTRLRPTVLDELGLVPALITHTDDCATRFPFTVDVEVTGERQRLPSEMETALYRIAQEALTNVAKHALANHVHVRLHFGDQEMTLGVSDDGVGMDVQDARQAAALGEGWGLAGIYERTDLMNGRIDIQSAPGAGTRLTVQVPIPHTSPSCEGEEL